MSKTGLFNRPEVISDFAKKLKPVGRILEDPEYNVWCCSPIYDEQGRVHVFYARWLNGYDHLGWVAASEVAHAVADHPEGPYTTTGTVLKGERSGAWDSWSIHNPTVYKMGDKFVLLYMGSTGRDLGVSLEEVMAMTKEEYMPYYYQLTATKRVGMAIADSLDGPWERVGNQPMVMAGESGDWDDRVTSNPAFIKHADGRYWLYYKGWDYASHEAVHGNRRYGISMSDNLTGPYKKYEGNPVVDFSPIDPRVQCEDAYVWQEDNQYHMIVRDMGFYNHEYGLMMHSSDGIHWGEPEIAFKDAPHYFDEKMPGLDRQGRFERPQILMKDGRPDYLFCAYRGGQFRTSSAVVLKIEQNHPQSK
ncbi:MAG: glycoside hydrolase family protein [Coraliomargaritaceae bacterium]